MPHSQKGKGSYSSVVEMMKNEEGFPHTIELRTKTGVLKVTKESLKEGFSIMKTHIDTLSL
jgi:hypothetical protein